MWRRSLRTLSVQNICGLSPRTTCGLFNGGTERDDLGDKGLDITVEVMLEQRRGFTNVTFDLVT